MILTQYAKEQNVRHITRALSDQTHCLSTECVVRRMILDLTVDWFSY